MSYCFACSGQKQTEINWPRGLKLMKYYIIKAKSVSVREDILQGLRQMDKSADIVNKIEDCDIAILQQGWTRSKTAIAEKDQASYGFKKPCREGYLYTDKYKVHLN